MGIETELAHDTYLQVARQSLSRVSPKESGLANLQTEIRRQPKQKRDVA